MTRTTLAAKARINVFVLFTDYDIWHSIESDYQEPTVTIGNSVLPNIKINEMLTRRKSFL